MLDNEKKSGYAPDFFVAEYFSSDKKIFAG